MILPLLLLLAACGEDASDDTATAEETTAEPETFDFGGSIAVPISVYSVTEFDGTPYVGMPCNASSGYSDITEGTQVTVRDAEGTIVALADLDSGTMGGEVGDLAMTAPCVFRFTAREVPDDSAFYEVGVLDYGSSTHTRAELDDRIELNIGMD